MAEAAGSPSARRPGTLDDGDFDGRRLIDAQDLVSIEIGLLDTSFLEGDLAIERRGDAEDDRALDLRLDGVGTDDGAAIERADDPPHANRAIPRHFDFGNPAPYKSRRRTGPRRTADPFWHGCPPAGLFRGKLEDGFGAGRLSSRARLRVLLRRRQFVHEVFGHEDIVRSPSFGKLPVDRAGPFARRANAG